MSTTGCALPALPCGDLLDLPLGEEGVEELLDDLLVAVEDLVPVGPGTLGSWVLRYLDHQASRGYSEHTIRGASAHLRYFLVWADERGLRQPEEVTVSVLGRYQRWLFHYRGETGRPLSFRSQHDRLGSVRRFFRWLAKNRVLEMSPAELLELPKVERRLPRAVLNRGRGGEGPGAA